MSGEMIPIIFFICLALVVWSFFFYGSKAKKEQQDTIQKMIESGQALSPDLIASIAKPSDSDDSRDFSRGVLLISVALSVVLYGKFGIDSEPEFMSLGFFPLTLGIAYLFIWKFKPKSKH